jgi:homogentisate 1,2-dioxygenase
MAFYRSAGDVPHKRHTQHRSPDGTLYFEELMGEEGFSSDSSLLYHVNIPSAVVDVRPWELPDLTLTPNHPLTPRHFSTHALFPDDASADEVDAVTGRRLLMGNGDVRLSYVVATAPSPYYRNAIGDECLYVEAGRAVVETVFGDLAVGEGDYAIVPRATTFRVVPDGPVRIYVIEANSHIGPPKRYLSRFGQLLEHAPYCERDLRGPTGPRVVPTDPGDPAASDVEVLIKHRGPGPGGIAGSIHTLPHHPFDVVGWDGCLYPYAFNIADYEPITGRVHQPPPVHQVFEGHNFVICNFVPRKVDYHPESIPVPYYHSNVDSDEVMFYCGGDYEARKGSGIGQGSISLHPGGHPHGPQPGAYERSIGVDYFDELAVMVDTFRPLDLGEAALATDDGVYAYSWSGGRRLGQEGS